MAGSDIIASMARRLKWDQNEILWRKSRLTRRCSGGYEAQFLHLLSTPLVAPAERVRRHERVHYILNLA
jgi:hypothetical protein